MDATVVIFLLSYAALAIGRIPGFRVDRTGAVLLGAIALIVSRAGALVCLACLALAAGWTHLLSLSGDAARQPG